MNAGAPAPQPAALWRPLAARPAPGSEGPDDGALRVAVLVVHGSAMTALVVAGVLPAGLAVVAAAVAVGLSLLARACLTRPWLGTLRITLWATVALLTLVMPFLVAGPRGLDPPTVLGVFVAGFLAATSADQDGTRRAMLMNLALGLAVLALGAGLAPFLARSSPDASLAVALLVGWAAALVALVRAARRYPVVAVDARGRSGVRAASPAGGGAARRGPVRAVPRPGSSTPRTARWRGTAGVVAATMAVSLLAFALVTRLPQSQASQNAEVSGPADGGLFGGRLSREGAAAPRSVTGTYSGGTLDLRARGDLPDTPVMIVPAESPTLWRSAALDTYTGQTWAQPSMFGAGSRRVGGEVDLSRDDDPTPRGGPQRTDAVRWLASGTVTLPRPGVADTLSLPVGLGAMLADDGTVVVVSGGSGDAPDGFGYRVTSRPRATVADADRASSPVTAHALRAAAPGLGPVAGDPRAADVGRWIQQSGTETDRTRALARRLVAGTGTRYDAVRAVEAHLRATTRYTLDAPVPDDGEDIVDDFLFDSREGFCEQYATAEIVLLRSVGIPARLAVGFAGGSAPGGSLPEGAVADGTAAEGAVADGTAAAVGDTRVVRGTDAHAWVEVWFPGVGWVSSDPTAGATLADPPALDRVGGWLREHAVLVTVVVAQAALAIGLGVLVARRRRRSDDGRSLAPGPRAVGGAVDLLAAFDRLEAALVAVGAPRLTAETLAELGVRLARGDARVAEEAAVAVATEAAGPSEAVEGARPTEPGGTLHGAIDVAPDGDPVVALGVLERLLYGPTPPPAGDLRAAATALDTVAARVLAADRFAATAR